MAKTIDTDGSKIQALAAGINLTMLRTAIPELEAAFNHKAEAAETFKNCIAVVAIKTGIIEGVLTQYITARCNDTVRKKARSAEQLTLLFAEIE